MTGALALSWAVACCSTLVASTALAETHLRLRPGLRAGVGWGSDLFLGGRVGPSEETQLAPSLRADLSLSPRWKLFGEYAAALGTYYVNGTGSLETSFDQQLVTGARLRLAPSVQAELAATGERQDLSASQAIQETGFEAVRDQAGGFDATLRLGGDRQTYELRYGLAFGLSVLEGGDRVSRATHLGTLAFRTELGPFTTRLSARATRELSGQEQFGYLGGSLHLAVALPIRERALVQALASIHRNAFDLAPEASPLDTRIDTFTKLGLATTYQLSEAWALEGSYGFALNRTRYEYQDRDVERHFVYLGVRVESDVVRF